MRPIVRDLYKRVLVAARDYPGMSEASVKRKAKDWFFANAHLADDVAIKKAVVVGRNFVKDMRATTSLAKYRAMKRRYG